jgi:IS4 transposase
MFVYNSYLSTVNHDFIEYALYTYWLHLHVVRQIELALKLKLTLKLNYDRQSASPFWCQAPI